jgi:cytochrome c
MSGLEFNKIAAAVLVAGLVGMVTGNLADILYKPNINAKHGYTIAVTETSATTSDAAIVEVKVDIIGLLSKASAENGANLVKKCSVCHDFTKNGPNRVGPNMWGIVGNKKAHRDDFTYSKALATKGGTWTYEDLFHMIHKPIEFLPGTKMNFIGFKKPEDVADVIAYLRTLSDNPVPLPTK